MLSHLFSISRMGIQHLFLVLSSLYMSQKMVLVWKHLSLFVIGLIEHLKPLNCGFASE